MKTTLGQLAELVVGTVEGDADIAITGVAGIREARRGQITFIANARYGKLYAACTKASAVVLADDISAGCCRAELLRVKDPDTAFVKIANHFAPEPIRYPPGIHPTAVIADDAELGRGVSIGAYVVIEPGARIGDRCIILPHTYVGHYTRIGSDCLLHSGVKVREGTTIGDRVVIHCGVVIGADGFGFNIVEGKHVKIPQVGTVEIEDDVEIGANVTIDRARFGKTHIGRGTKIDNLVQIGHNVWVGDNCILVSQVGIAGSTRLGDYVILAGQVGVGGHLDIGDGVTAAGRAGISKDIEPGQIISGVPAQPVDKERRMQVYVRRLPKAYEKIRELHERLTALEEAAKND